MIKIKRACIWFVNLVMKGCQKLFGGLSNGIALTLLLAAQFALIAGALKILPNNTIAMAIAAWAITIVSTVLIGIKPITYFMIRFNRAEIEKEFEDKKKVEEIIQKYTNEEKKLNSELSNLKSEIAVKDSEIDTLKQSKYLVTNYSPSRKLELLTVSKSGNIVKEEDLYPLKNVKNENGKEIFSNIFPQKYYVGSLGRDIESSDNWRVFYSDNKLYKYGVGIELNDVYYAEDPNSNIIYFKNIKLSLLEDRREKMYGIYDPDENLTNHVWIVKRDYKGNYTIINEQQHNDFKKHYSGFQRNMAGVAIQNAIDKLCERFTEGLHKMLIARYGNSIRFVQDDENVDQIEWKTLSEGLRTNKDVKTFMNDLYLAFDSMQLCADNNPYLDKSLIPEQAGA